MSKLINKLIKCIHHYWYQKKIPFFLYIFYPIEVLYLIIIYIRKLLYKYKIFKTYKFNLPIIVVGNLTVGGTGKTPMVIYLVNYLQSKGLKIAVIMRGYGSQHLKYNNCNKHNSTEVIFDHSINSEYYYGDEPVMLAKKLNCPVIIGKNRVKSVEYLLANYKLDLIISDDGLQHYALHRDLEIIMLDGDRCFGNYHLLPLGPLRTRVNDLKNVNFIMINNNVLNNKNLNFKSLNNYHNIYRFNNIYKFLTDKLYNIQLIPNQFINLLDPNLNKKSNYFKKVHAVAGIGNNQKFFDLLNSLNIVTINHHFPDHYKYKPQDLDFNDGLPVIMTEKDAVKCTSFAKPKYWQLKVNLQIKNEEKFQQELFNYLYSNRRKKLI